MSISRTGPVLLKQFCFAAGVSGAVFCGAAIGQYERAIKEHDRFVRTIKAPWRQFSTKTRNWWDDLIERTGWRRLTDGQKLFAGIAGINLIVYGLWKVPALQSTMVRNFTCGPSSRPLYRPMLLSMFSHHSLIHLCLNMYVLKSFIEHLDGYLGREQLLAMYVGAGVCSSWFSKTVKILSRSSGVSIGASGAIFSLVAFSCSLDPDGKLGIVFLPGLEIPAGKAIMGLITVDTLGVLLRWKFLDHGAHLGGALFGLGYFYFGQDQFLSWRNAIIRQWHRLRTNREK